MNIHVFDFRFLFHFYCLFFLGEKNGMQEIIINIMCKGKVYWCKHQKNICIMFVMVNGNGYGGLDNV